MHNSRNWHYLELRVQNHRTYIVLQVHTINYWINRNAFSFYKPTPFRFNSKTHKENSQKTLEQFSEMQNSQLKYRSRFVYLWNMKALNVYICDLDSSHSQRKMNWNSEFVKFYLHEYRINSNASLSDIPHTLFFPFIFDFKGLFGSCVKKDADRHRCHRHHHCRHDHYLWLPGDMIRLHKVEQTVHTFYFGCENHFTRSMKYAWTGRIGKCTNDGLKK